MNEDSSMAHAKLREASLAAEAAGWNTRAIEDALPGDIPVIDVSAALGQRASSAALDDVARQLGEACRRVGFFSLLGHGVSGSLIDQVFAQNQRFHAQDLAAKQALAMDKPGAVQGVGYLPPMHRKLPRRSVGNNNEAFIIKRDGVLRLSDNPWPPEDQLADFRDVLERYAVAMERLALRLLPLYARSLGMPDDFFTEGFTDPLYRLRLTHYPALPAEELEAIGGEGAGFGIAPHVDTTFFTILAQDTPGLVVYSEQRKLWLRVPLLEGALVVNTGELLKQWTNDRYLSVKHFANNLSTASRYSVPFFFNANSDYPMTCVPTCTGPGNPPRYPAVSYAQSQGVVQGE